MNFDWRLDHWPITNHENICFLFQQTPYLIVQFNRSIIQCGASLSSLTTHQFTPFFSLPPPPAQHPRPRLPPAPSPRCPRAKRVDAVFHVLIFLNYNRITKYCKYSLK